jgi:hypothetical protein
MREAVDLARDGEIGNSNAIRLLQLPHSPADLQDVLQRFEGQPLKRGQLSALAAMVPLPDGVENQRYEPIFDRCRSPEGPIRLQAALCAERW